MADDTSKKSSNTLLYLGLAGAVGAYLLSKSSPATDPASWLSTTAATDPSGTGVSSTSTPTSAAPNSVVAGLLATAPAMAPAMAPTTAPVNVDTGGNIFSDGAPHRHAGADQALTNFSEADVNSIRAIVARWNIKVEDAIDVISFQERQDSKSWSQVAKDYATNPSWFQDKAREWNATNPKYRISI